MACEKCDCGKTPPGMSGNAKGAENENEIDMTAMWTPRTTAVPERGLAKEGDARAETEEQCPGISSEKCCQASQEESRRALDSILSRDLIIGLSDGLTVPFALTAGLSALGSSHLVVVGGLAELISGAISMGVGGYFSTKAERDNYHYLLHRTTKQVEKSCRSALEKEILSILGPYGLTAEESKHVLQCLEVAERTSFDTANKGLVGFFLKFGMGVENIATWRIYASAVTIGLSYLVGGLIPMIPYFIEDSARKALFISIGVTAFILLVFGVIKGYYTGSRSGWKQLTVAAVQTLMIGALAAGASYGIVVALEQGHNTITST